MIFKLKPKAYTPQQLASMVGKKPPYVNQLTSKIGPDGEVLLDECRPFPYEGGAGPKFIIANEKTEAFIAKYKKM